MDANSLTTEQLLEATKKYFPPKPDTGLSAIAAIKAAKENLGSRAKHAERLLDEVLPQTFQFLEVAHSMRAESQEDFRLPSDAHDLTWEQVVEQLEKNLDDMANSDSPSVKRAYHLARVRSWLYPKPTDEFLAIEAWNKIHEAEYLTPTEKGSVIFGSQSYDVDCKRFCFKQSDANEICGQAREICNKMASMMASHNEPKNDPPQPRPTPKALSKISAKAVWHKHSAGKFELCLPPNGNGLARVLYMESQPTEKNGPMLVVADTKGIPEFRAGEHLPLSAIQDDNGDFRKGLRIILDPTSGSDMAEKQRHFERLGEMLKKAFAIVLTPEVLKEIDPVDFLRGATGEASIEFPATFEWRPKGDHEGNVDFDNLAIRWARNQDGQIALLEIVSGGRKAQKVFGENIGEFQDPGTNFWGVKPFVCGLLLRACYGALVLGKTSNEE